MAHAAAVMRRCINCLAPSLAVGYVAGIANHGAQVERQRNDIGIHTMTVTGARVFTMPGGPALGGDLALRRLH